MNHEDVTLIVREAGERTVRACTELLSQIFPGQPIEHIAAGSFPETLRASLLKGIASGRPWTLCVDADVLPLPTIRDFIAEAKQLPPSYCEAQALVADKLLPAQRPAGNHLYRTALLPHALEYLPRGPVLRPESSMIEAMVAAGFPYHQSDCLVGLHDFEQWPQDLFNKAALHGHKHDYLAELILPLWQRWSNQDPDYRIALMGFAAAKTMVPPDEVSRGWGKAQGQELLATMEQTSCSSLAPLKMSQVETLLQQAPHLQAEASLFRQRLESDITAIIRHQRLRYLATYPWWRRQFFRLSRTLPMLPCPSH